MDLPVVRYTCPLSDGLARYLMDLPFVRYTRPLSDGLARYLMDSPATQKCPTKNTTANHNC